MQTLTITNGGKRYRVNVPTEDGVGPGFPIGSLVMKSPDNNSWFIITSSGSMASATASVYVSQSALSFITGSDGTNYYDQNFPYQLLAAPDGYAYAVSLTGSIPNITAIVSQVAWGKSYITNSQNAIIDTAKPSLSLQSISDGSYNVLSLGMSGSNVVFAMNGISSSLTSSA